MLSDGELNHILGKWISYKPASKAQVGNTTFMKSEINDVDPSSLHASYNAWHCKLRGSRNIVASLPLCPGPRQP